MYIVYIINMKNKYYYCEHDKLWCIVPYSNYVYILCVVEKSDIY